MHLNLQRENLFYCGGVLYFVTSLDCERRGGSSMSQRSVTKEALGVLLFGLIGLIGFVGLLAGAVAGHDGVALLAQNVGLVFAVLAMLVLMMLSLGRGS